GADVAVPVCAGRLQPGAVLPPHSCSWQPVSQRGGGRARLGLFCASRQPHIQDGGDLPYGGAQFEERW
ncbi:hypothetical protein M9458_031695, partial [Cirrhinus mrigala]